MDAMWAALSMRMPPASNTSSSPVLPLRRRIFDAGDEDFENGFEMYSSTPRSKPRSSSRSSLFGGEHDDRDFGVLADFAADLPAVHFWAS